MALVAGVEATQLKLDGDDGSERAFGDGGPFVEHPADLGLERPRTPPLDAAHLGVELPLQRVVDGGDLAQMGPCQLCPQCVHNRLVGEELGKAKHVVKVTPVESAPVLGAQLGGHGRDDLFAVLGPLLTEEVGPVPLADLSSTGARALR